MSSRVRKPIKATLPMPSLLKSGTIISSTSRSGSGNNSSLVSPPRHISPDHSLLLSGGHRSPGALNYKGKSHNHHQTSDITGQCIRRTASLDALYMRPTWNSIPTTILHLDKSTQTDEDLSYYSEFDRTKIIIESLPPQIPNNNQNMTAQSSSQSTPDLKIEKIIRQRQRIQRSGGGIGGEHSVSSQTLSPVHTKASPVLIPPRTCPPAHMRPMRSSVEGLNQEIEKLVLIPGQQHTCRPETSSMVSCLILFIFLRWKWM